MRWVDEETGVEAVIEEFATTLRISLYGLPSMTSDDGRVAIGADLPDELAEHVRGLIEGR